ncbi:MAG: methyltransferase domain-containing protein [Candidatus Aminicenantes bacterium]|mgnify:CR=1 FL=1|nr:methyltransferase domain-containing protein [Candidatus Aminicenantes bacterium]
MNLFEQLERINSRPKPFEFYTAAELWTNDHTSAQMLRFHLDESVDLSSRNHAFIERSVEWIIRRFNIGPGVAVADFGCGPGLYTTPLARTGAAVAGIDFSRRSIGHAMMVAAEQDLDIAYHCQDYLEFETPKRFDLIIMIFCDFCALSPMQRKALLEKYRAFLKPDGSLLMDVHSLNVFDQKKESAAYEINQLNGFWSPDRYYGFVNSFKYEDEKVSLDKYTIIEKDRARTVYNWLQYFSREALEKELTRNGFKAEVFFSDVAGTPFDPGSPDLAVVARKS